MQPSKRPVKPKGKPGRPPAVVVKVGMTFGHLRIRQKLTTKERGNTWMCVCLAPSGPNGAECGNKVRVRQHYLFRPEHPKTSCGCMTYIHANKYKRERVIWQMMNRRCLYRDHVSYKYYGAIGIKPCDRWIETNPDGFKNFLADMGPAPSIRHSLERQNPNYGYAPFCPDEDRDTREVKKGPNGEVLYTRQCVWATADVQANNKRHHWATRQKRAAAVAAQVKANNNNQE